MNSNRLPLLVLLVVEAAIAIFILATVGSLPDTVASHFGGSGVPNGFMSLHGYLVFILVFAIGIPTLVVVSLSAALRFSENLINIPNRTHWLSPENRQKTADYLTSHVAWLGTLICLFIGYVHWLLLQANRVQPARLSENALFVGMGLLVAGIVLWGAFLMRRFSRVPKA